MLSRGRSLHKLVILSIEILSPEQNTTKVIRNIIHCLKHGTKLGWLIDPDERVVLVFLPEESPLEITRDELLPLPEFLQLDLTATQIFAWLKPTKPGNRPFVL